MLGKSILWILPAQTNHVMVAKHFGQDRGRRNWGLSRIGPNQRFPGVRYIWKETSIHHHEVRARVQAEHRTAHRNKGGLMNVMFVNLPDGRSTY